MKTVLFLALLFGFIASAFAACAGDGSCDLLLRSSPGNCSFCDCSITCNSCHQLLGGCGAHMVENLLIARDNWPDTLLIGKEYSLIIQDRVGNNNPRPLTDICIFPPLPAGGQFVVTLSEGKFRIQARPSQVMPATTFTIFVKGADFVAKGTLTFAIARDCPQTPPSGSCSVFGTVRCHPTDSMKFQTCVPNDQGVLNWGADQSCPGGLVCRTSGNTVVCDFPNQITGTQITGAQITGSVPPPSGSCSTFGNLRCRPDDNTKFQTCLSDDEGELNWGGDQSCPAGLVCRASGNTVICDFPSNPPQITGTQITGAQITGSVPPPSGSCSTFGNLRCKPNDNLRFQTCVPNDNGELNWGADQSCPAGLVCRASGNTIICDFPDSNPPQITGSVPPPSNACNNFGTLRCKPDDRMKFQTCLSDDRGALNWGGEQSCPAGLVCKVSGSTVICDFP